MADSETFDCFLSHNSRDEPAVRALAAALRVRGVRVWLDKDELRPGIPWMSLLEAGIRAARSVAVLVGTDGLGPWEDEETQAALRLAVRDKRPVIPVLLPDAPAVPAPCRCFSTDAPGWICAGSPTWTIPPRSMP
jgi:hypothetical protein